MDRAGFNDQGEKPLFLHKPNPLVPRSYQIFTLRPGKADYEPIGDYTVIDTSEPIDITEKKMINLMAILNGHRKLIDFKSLTNVRVLFNIVPTAPESTQEKVVFRTFDGKGVSKENAVLTIEKGVFDES